MPDACRALLDLNVVLDVFQRRQPFYLLAKYGSPGRPARTSC